MLIPLRDLCLRHGLTIKGVIHLGAHECEEREQYLAEGITDDRVFWVEAIPEKVEWCTQKYPRISIAEAVVGAKDRDPIEFIVTNNFQSSSMLPLHFHRAIYPNIVEVRRFRTETTRTDTLLAKSHQDVGKFNFLNMDLQGAELLALQGCGSLLLNQLSYIYTEINIAELYKGCAHLKDMDSFLSPYGFLRLDTVFTPYGWGDAFYMKIINS